MATVDQVTAAYLAVNRTAISQAQATATAAAIDAGTTSLDATIATYIANTVSTTAPAIAILSYVDGVTPSSAKITELATTFEPAQNAYYRDTLKVGAAQLAIAPFEATGRAVAQTDAAFKTQFGTGTDADFITTNYIKVFGINPTAAAAANLQAQITYFTSLYTASGIAAADAALQARGSVLGQIIGYAFTDPAFIPLSTLDNQVALFETQIAKGNTTAYGQALPPVTNPGTAGVDITLVAATNAVSTGQADPALRSTANNDTIRGTLAAAGATTIGDTTSISAAGGTDTLLLTIDATAADRTYTPAVDALTSVEQVAVKSVEGANDNIVDLTNTTGVTLVTLATGSTTGGGTTTFQNLGSSTVVGVTGVANNLTVDFKSATVTTAEVNDDGAYTGKITFNDASVVTVNVHTFGATNSIGFADNDIKTLKIDGTGTTLVTGVGTALTTFDASASGGFVNVDLTGAVLASKGTFTLGGFSDSLTLDLTKAHTVTLGAGNDTIKFNNTGAGNITDITSATTIATGAAVVTDLKVSGAAGDILTIKGAAVTVVDDLTQTQLDQAFAAADLKAALLIVAAATDAANVNGVAIFEFKGDAYVYTDYTGNGLDVGTGDTLVKLTGITDLTTLHTTAVGGQNVFVS